MPRNKVEVAVVVHGKATPLVLSDKSYRQHFGKPNPDTALIAQLHRAGVKIYVCGQALTHQGYAVADVRGDIRVAQSVMTSLDELLASCYGLIPSCAC